ncbi:Prokaryotic metallothionein [Nocardiopsis sp. FIRDI 009]|uniref:Prokaryotic metallothionein n=1 Tax=Nocardiopsis sp. FIRDI 009 TaxID=714197 RepID=UPI000E21D53A|nr:Prokaryotic metallothionein [Nocardiopsis sp. FIRDI 009]
MAVCDTCHNDYWMSFDVETINGERYTFDCFECAIQRLAPVCEKCSSRIIGHGVEVEGRFFCSAHCAREGATSDLAQRICDSVGAHP